MPQPARPWTRLVLSLSGLKVVAAVAAIVWELDRVRAPVSGALPVPVYLTFLVVYGGWGAFLLIGGRGDPRARSLAGFYLSIAAAYTKPLRHLAPLLGEPWTTPLLVLDGMAFEAFIPYFLWSFARDFPAPARSPRGRRLLALGVRATGWMGVAFLAGIAAARYRAPNPVTRVVDPLFVCELVVGVTTALAFVALLIRARAERGDDRERVRLFVGAFVAGLAPLVVPMAVRACVPAVDRFIDQRPALALGMLYGAFVPAWITPCATAYSVLVHRILTVRLIARQALQHGLARYATLAVAAVPFLALAAYLFLHRWESVESILTGRRLLLLMSALILGIAGLRYRTRLLDAIDRRYFREQYDARQILTLVVQRIRDTHNVHDLAELLCRGIDQALHLESIALLVEDRRSGHLVAPMSRARRLDTSSALAQLAASASDPLTVDPGDPQSPFARLPETDRRWLAESRFRLLVPLVARDGTLLGLLGLGQKKSGLGFLREDRKLLYDIASWAALGLELDLDHTSTIPRQPPEMELHSSVADHAKECLSCGTLFQPFTVFCGSCSRRLETAPVPYVIPGRYRFERRLGVGGMGVVYRGGDLPLGRPVAAKTLRRVSPEGAMRLRREARTAAGVSHPHLAAVYGMETWQGTPMLILELMEGGTLAQRIERGPLDQRETVELGIAMASALEHLHGADILHRDIKPSNIGFTRGSFGHGGVPKLMDFGIARLMLDLRQDRDGGWSDEEPEPSAPRPGATWSGDATSETVERQLVGTLSYLSPEALDREAAAVSFDLWALAIVLYECVLGRKIFSSPDFKATSARIRLGRIPDFEQACPWGHPALGEFFRNALHRTIARRPATARELRARLENVLRRLI